VREPDGNVQRHDLWALALRIVVLALALGIGLWLAVTLRGILLQVLLAIILAAGLGPLVGWLQGRGIPRAAAVLLIYALVIGALVLFGVAVIPPVIREIQDVVHDAPAYGERLVGFLHDLRDQYPFLPPLDEQLIAQLRGLGSQIGAIAAQALSVARLALSFFSGVLTAILVLLITLYLVVDGQRVREYLLSFLQPRQAARARLVGDRIGPRIGGWLLGQIALSATIGLVSYVGLTVLGVQGAVLLAVIAAIGEVIPIVGPIGSAVPAVIVALTQSPLLALATVVLYIMIQQLENNLLVPRIMERAVNLHPLAVILALLVGGELLGIAGAVVAVPVAAALAVVLDEVRHVRAVGPPLAGGGPAYPDPRPTTLPPADVPPATVSSPTAPPPAGS
jgi:predicted PurR-regulated permease PerM